MTYFARSRSNSKRSKRIARPGDKPDLGSLLDHYGVEWRPGPGNQKVLCPVHAETEPSCSVNVDKGLWRCFSCGEEGDAWTLIMRKEACDFAKAKDHARDMGLVMVAGDGSWTGSNGSERAPSGTAAKPYVPSWRRRGQE